jgi:ribosomal protein S18 acetylase RimI-like enzyme
VRAPRPASGATADLSSGAVPIRPLRRSDLSEIVRIHELHTGVRELAYWEAVMRRVQREGEAREVALAAVTRDGLAAFLVGEVRAFEFGSDPCGWVFAVGVDPRFVRGGTASQLLDEACRCFRAMGVTHVRTMVRRNDVPLLAFFRSNGFAGGAFVQLERELEEGDAT